MTYVTGKMNEDKVPADLVLLLEGGNLSVGYLVPWSEVQIM